VTGAILVLAVAGAVSTAEAQPGEAPCRAAEAHLAARDARGAERALRAYGPDETPACALAAWGRIAEARRAPIRAATFYARSLRAEPALDEAVRIDVERRAAALSSEATLVAAALLDETEPPAVATERAVCDLASAREELAYYDLGRVTCVVVRRAGAQAIAMRVRRERVTRAEDIVIALRDAAGWRVAGACEPVYTGQGGSGRLTLRSLRVEPDAVVAEIDREQHEDGAATRERRTLRCTAGGCTEAPSPPTTRR
jgi:hypothetical protein